jgi:DNA-binding PadR family transcriptional regulator
MHGYEIIRRLEEDSGGMYSPSPGSVYPTLQLLEDQGSVISEQQEGKRVYRITDEGRTLLGEHGDRVSDFTDRFSFVRLAQVSFERASRKAADPEALGRLQEILERATREVEESWPGPGKRASSKS